MGFANYTLSDVQRFIKARILALLEAGYSKAAIADTLNITLEELERLIR